LIAEGDEVVVDPATERLASGVASSTAGSGSAPLRKQEGRWSIVLATVSGSNHEVNAKAILQKVQQESPEVRNAFIRPTERGSAVWLGRFHESNSPAAKAALARVRAITKGGRAVFGTAFMSVLPDDSSIGPLDLRRARLMHPGINPLYTFQIAAWGTFGGNQISWAAVQKEAARYAGELRRRGHQAWYYHDSLTELSVVTIGVFDRRAYDAQSTLFSPEVELLRRKFPRHLINGEEVMVELKSGDPRSRIPQECRLVVVPELP
jgi:hypothetical protein